MVMVLVGQISWVMVCIDGAEPARGDDVPLSSLAHGDCTGDMSHGTTRHPSSSPYTRVR